MAILRHCTVYSVQASPSRLPSLSPSSSPLPSLLHVPLLRRHTSSSKPTLPLLELGNVEYLNGQWKFETKAKLKRRKKHWTIEGVNRKVRPTADRCFEKKRKKRI